MREVLLQLELTSNGATAAYDSSGGGTPDYALVDDWGRGRLGVGDAPHLTHRAAWRDARDDVERRSVLEAARAELAAIRRSRANQHAGEPQDALAQRIVQEGRGWPAREVAIAMRCGVRLVWRVRAAAGLDVEFGEPARDGRAMSRDELHAEIRRLHAKGMSGREIATALNIAHGSVRYAMARALRNG